MARTVTVRGITLEDKSATAHLVTSVGWQLPKQHKIFDTKEEGNFPIITKREDINIAATFKAKKSKSQPLAKENNRVIFHGSSPPPQLHHCSTSPTHFTRSYTWPQFLDSLNGFLSSEQVVLSYGSLVIHPARNTLSQHPPLPASSLCFPPASPPHCHRHR